jgi:hypothetical protein
VTWLRRLWAWLRDPERCPECGLTRRRPISSGAPATGEMTTIFKLPVAIGRHPHHQGHAGAGREAGSWVVAVGPPVPSGDRPGRHQEPGGRIMRAKNAFTSGEASVSSAASRRLSLSCLLVARTMAGPVIAAAFAFFAAPASGGRHG